MAKVVTYVFGTLFERKESVSYREQKTVVLIFGAIAALTVCLLFII
jgi:hypothetical protein